MKNAINFQMLQQVYNFMAEKPNFKTKTELDLLLEFFSEIQQDQKTGVRLDSPSKIIGKFGSRQIININLAPPIRHKNEFLTWVYKQLHR